jgi:hypothetical protein
VFAIVTHVSYGIAFQLFAITFFFIKSVRISETEKIKLSNIHLWHCFPIEQNCGQQGHVNHQEWWVINKMSSDHSRVHLTPRYRIRLSYITNGSKGNYVCWPHKQTVDHVAWFPSPPNSNTSHARSMVDVVVFVFEKIHRDERWSSLVSILRRMLGPHGFVTSYPISAMAPLFILGCRCFCRRLHRGEDQYDTFWDIGSARSLSEAACHMSPQVNVIIIRIFRRTLQNAILVHRFNFQRNVSLENAVYTRR